MIYLFRSFMANADTNTIFFLSLSIYLACNVVSQTPEGSFTMVIPQQHRNCSFSIIYPVEIQIGELSLGQHNDLKVSLEIKKTHKFDKQKCT